MYIVQCMLKTCLVFISALMFCVYFSVLYLVCCVQCLAQFAHFHTFWHTFSTALMYRFRCVQLYGTTCTKANCRGSQTLFPVHIVPLLVSESHRSFTEVSKLRLLLPSACLLEQQLCPHIASCHPFINCYINYNYYCPGHVKKTSF